MNGAARSESTHEMEASRANGSGSGSGSKAVRRAVALALARAQRQTTRTTRTIRCAWLSAWLREEVLEAMAPQAVLEPLVQLRAAPTAVARAKINEGARKLTRVTEDDASILAPSVAVAEHRQRQQQRSQLIGCTQAQARAWARVNRCAVTMSQGTGLSLMSRHQKYGPSSRPRATAIQSLRRSRLAHTCFTHALGRLRRRRRQARPLQQQRPSHS